MKKKNSAKRRLLSAAGMLAISAAMLSSATFAWFTMNKSVTVTGLQTKAKAEQGIVIAAFTGANHGTAPGADDYADSAAATAHDPAVELKPTFTSAPASAGGDLTWWHTYSTKSNNGQVHTSAGYTDVTGGAETASAENEFYLYDKFNIKSPGGAQAVYVKNIEVKSGGEQDYDGSIRVCIKSGDATLFFTKDGNTVVTTTTNPGSKADDGMTSALSITTLTENTAATKILNDVAATPEAVEIYVYYDGEDVACKSDNIPAAFAATTIDVTFTTDAENLSDAGTP